jgi:hypothetical protein
MNGMKAKAIVKLRKGEGRTLKSGGLWVYDNEIDRITGIMWMETWYMCMTLTIIIWAVDLLTPNPRSESELCQE